MDIDSMLQDKAADSPFVNIFGKHSPAGFICILRAKVKASVIPDASIF